MGDDVDLHVVEPDALVLICRAHEAAVVGLVSDLHHQRLPHVARSILAPRAGPRCEADGSFAGDLTSAGDKEVDRQSDHTHRRAAKQIDIMNAVVITRAWAFGSSLMAAEIEYSLWPSSARLSSPSGETQNAVFEL
jgi:hypothetical protein